MDRSDECCGEAEETSNFQCSNTMRSVAFVCQPRARVPYIPRQAAVGTQAMFFPLSYPEEREKATPRDALFKKFVRRRNVTRLLDANGPIPIVSLLALADV
jgi:hypothetical protein